MSNAQVTRDVLDELLWDDRIDASRITVTEDDGTVVLGGTVDHYHEKWNASEDAQRVVGVRAVRNEIAVDAAARKVLDDELAAAARAGLDANGLVPDNAIIRSPAAADCSTVRIGEATWVTTRSGGGAVDERTAARQTTAARAASSTPIVSRALRTAPVSPASMSGRTIQRLVAAIASTRMTIALLISSVRP